MKRLITIILTVLMLALLVVPSYAGTKEEGRFLKRQRRVLSYTISVLAI